MRLVLVAAAALVATALAGGSGGADDLQHGQDLFQRCAPCHSLEASPRRMPGPSLHGVIGRRAGSLPGFDFSDAMVEAGRDRGLVWSEATLFDYLDDTDAYVPGTAMGYLRVANPADRRALILYLKARGGGGS